MAPSNMDVAFLETQPAVARKFLRAAGATPDLRALLELGGYTHAAHREGLRLLAGCCGAPFHDPRPSTRTVAEAHDALEAMRRSFFVRVDVALHRDFEEQRAYVLFGVSRRPGVDPAAVLERMLDRIDDLAEGTIEDDRAAMVALRRRGVGARVRVALRDLVAVSRDEVPAPMSRVECLRALHLWLRGWVKIARVLLSRREHRVRLGIATKRLPVARNATRRAACDERDDVAPVSRAA